MSSHAPPRSAPGAAVFVALALAVCAVAGLFYSTFSLLVHRWEADPNYSHGYLVGPISLVLAFFALRKAGWPEKGELPLGLAYVGCGVIIHLAALVLSWPLVDFLALAAVLRGLAVAAGGRQWAAALTFPIVFLLFMFPWPTAWMARAALFLQESVAVISTTVLDLFVVCYRQGTSLHLAGVKEPLVVAEECSGLRQIVAFLALGALLGKLSGRSMPFRLVLLLLAVPVAVLANVLRVVLMAAGAVWYGTSWLDSWLHHAPAMFSLPLGIALFLGLLWVMEKLWPARKAPEVGRIANPSHETEEKACPSPSA
jgi:exosortase